MLQNRGSMPSATRSIDVKVPVETLMAVLCDFDRYPMFLSSVFDSRIQFETRGQWRVLFESTMFRRRVVYTLDYWLLDETTLSWALVEGDWLTENEGTWYLSALEPHATRATYQASISIEGVVPYAAHSLLFDASVPRLLRDFKRRAEHLVTGTRPF